MRLRTFLLLLVLAIVVPVAIVEYRHWTLGPTTRNASHWLAPDTSPAIAPATGGGAATPSTEPREGRSVPAPSVQALVHLQGLVRAGLEVVQASTQLEVVTPLGSRPAWTSDAGTFSIALRPDEFPAALRTSAGVLLHETSRPTAGDVTVAIHEVHSRTHASDLIRPRVIAFERQGGDCRVLARGATALPAGSSVVMRLLGGGDKILQESLHEVGAASDVLGQIEFPEHERLYSGWYHVQLLWRPLSADPAVLATLRPILPADLPPEYPERLWVPVYLGTTAEEALQEAEILDFYRRALSACRDSRDLLRWVGAELRGEPSAVEPAAARQLERHPVLKRVPALVEGRRVQLDAWRALIDQEFPALWTPFRGIARVPYVAKYPRRATYLDGALDNLHRLAHLESRLLYRKLGQPPHPRDFLDYEFGPETEHSLAIERLARDLELLEADLARSARRP